jgi:hypothetical protein
MNSAAETTGLGSNENNVESNMTTSTLNTLNSTVFAPAADSIRASRPSLFKRLMARLIAGQEQRARRIVYAHLAHQSDDALARLGWTRAEIDALRRADRVGTAYPL